jgi:hypothetical protein
MGSGRKAGSQRSVPISGFVEKVRAFLGHDLHPSPRVIKAMVLIFPLTESCQSFNMASGDMSPEVIWTSRPLLSLYC